MPRDNDCQRTTEGRGRVMTPEEAKRLLMILRDQSQKHRVGPITGQYINALNEAISALRRVPELEARVREIQTLMDRIIELDEPGDFGSGKKTVALTIDRILNKERADGE